jgi:leucyl-tRNA synthetase
MPREHFATSPYRLWKKLKPQVRRMRKKPTPAEAALWKALRKSALGARFRRQHPIDRFAVDFVCLSRRLVVEVDGSIHDDPHQAGVDRERSAILNGLGFEVMRFRNEAVLTRFDAVVAGIRKAMESRPAHCVAGDEVDEDD